MRAPRRRHDASGKSALNRKISLKRRAFLVVSAASFLVASAGKAFGVDHCPQHDALPVRAAAVAAVRAEHATPGASHTLVPAGSAAHQHDGGPCTCVGCCHEIFRASVPAAGVAISLSRATTSSSGLSRDGAVLHGHRHQLYELHRPNAPPFLL